MNLHTARSMLIRDTMTYRKPHLSWIPSRYYRLFATLPKALRQR